ncbi:hypothetical protein [Alicyclobacillus fodiniaquatilis]|uniref:Uncharacterized protein n=1 Tax=Alicyclobacillus fodiniaquatilis TaxID=1661150 RepID=A0ABW4JI05_9BACL
MIRRGGCKTVVVLTKLLAASTLQAVSIPLFILLIFLSPIETAFFIKSGLLSIPDVQSTAQVIV